jgi:bacteriorhodopsin
MIEKSGEYALWIVCILNIVATVALALHSTYIHRKTRTFHLVTVNLTACSALLYYAMATGLGSTFIVSRIEHRLNEQGSEYDVIVLRQVFYIRFIAWAVMALLFDLELTLLCGLSWVDTLNLFVLTEFAILSFSMGAISRESL